MKVVRNKIIKTLCGKPFTCDVSGIPNNRVGTDSFLGGVLKGYSRATGWQQHRGPIGC